jgi:hypothetical protein
MVRAIVAATAAETSLGFGTRVWYAWVCFFKILFDGFFAKKVWSAEHGLSLPAPSESPTNPATPVARASSPSVAKTNDAALQLLALFQREGRFIDFLQEDVTTFSDADIGAAARVVHQGCRKALADHCKVVAVRTEEEGQKITLDKASGDVKLIGNVAGEAPFTGVLRHKGWRLKELHLPTAIDGHDLTVVAPAEVEL